MSQKKSASLVGGAFIGRDMNIRGVARGRHMAVKLCKH
jgi:hypothetical protein